MNKQTKSAASSLSMPIENFGDMQARYGMLPLASRASAVLADADPVMTNIKRILASLVEQPEISKAINNLRKNSLIISRIRASEAKTVLMDDSVDFIQATAKKLTGWHKTIWLISKGETKATLMKENIPEHLSMTGGSAYLAMIKLIIPELAKLDKKYPSSHYDTMLAELRRCTTVLSDCECASEMNSVVLH